MAQEQVIFNPNPTIFTATKGSATWENVPLWMGDDIQIGKGSVIETDEVEPIDQDEIFGTVWCWTRLGWL